MAEPRPTLRLEDLEPALRCLEDAFAAARDEVDALNVFPVPDGDTGTNLLLTVRAAVHGFHHPEDLPVWRAAGRGAVLGARGNSGVIFSQVIRAVTEHLADHELGAAELPAVLGRARDLAYEAVAEPVAGTILSAMDAAADAREESDELLPVLDAAVSATRDAVAATRDQLEENRRAGVVDAGARGFEVALEALRAYVAGEDPPDAHPPPVRRVRGDVVARESGSLEYAFEVQYLLEADDDVASDLRVDLETLGDSVVVVACGGLLNVHVHTNEIGASIEMGLDRGRPFRIQVTSFEDQISHLDVEPGARAVAEATRPQRAFGVVAVLPGRRLGAIARQAGAIPVHGAAGDLPPVADLADAARRAHADCVAVLPGHPNAVATARSLGAVMADDGIAVEVIESATTVPAVLAALTVADPDDPNPDTLREAAASVTAGEVVAAVRDADTPIGAVRAGQFLVVAAGDVVAVHDAPVDALSDLVRRLCRNGAELVTVLVGEEVDSAESHRAAAAAEEICGDIELEIIDGGQRPARYVVGAE